MTHEPADADHIFRTDYQADPRLAALLGPGGPFETGDVEVDGVTVRTFTRAPATIVDCFRAAAAHGDADHLVFEGERLTFAEVRRQAKSVARWLVADGGVQPGDRVAIAMRNFPEFVVGFWAAAVAGGIPVLLNSWWTGPELRYALTDAGARVVLADTERIGRLGAVFAGKTAPADDAPVIIAVRTAEGRPGDGLAWTTFEEVAAGAPLDDAGLAAPGPDDVATILYTSGTTGFPKGALITHRNIIASTMNMAFGTARYLARSGRTPAAASQPASVTATPLFHIGGVGAIVGGALGGSKTVLMRKWDVDEYLRLAVAENVTTLGGVPALARQVLEHPGAGRLRGRISSCPLGGAAVPPDLALLAREVLGPDATIFNGYGSTETTSAVVTNVGDEYDARRGSVGRPNLTAELRVIGPDGHSLPAGQVGELCFRSPQVVKGYWNDAEATKASFEQGWFRIGDLGYADADGFVYVVDRIKDVVIRGGENVYCAEVEAVLCAHPGVADVAVIGVPDRVMGERVAAAVVPRPGESVTVEGLRAFAAGRLAAFKQPEAVYLVAEIPQTPVGKPDKRRLRAELLSPDEPREPRDREAP